jgi:hypothetical protein
MDLLVRKKWNLTSLSPGQLATLCWKTHGSNIGSDYSIFLQTLLVLLSL